MPRALDASRDEPVLRAPAVSKPDALPALAAPRGVLVLAVLPHVPEPERSVPQAALVLAALREPLNGRAPLAQAH